MNLQLPDDLNEFVALQLSKGAYASTDEVVQDALRLLRDLHARRQKLIEDVQLGIEQADQGLLREIDLDEFLARCTAKLAEEGIRD